MSHGRKTPDEFVHLPFKDLKKLLKSRKKRTPPAPVKADKEDSDKLFQEAMQSVREIKEFRELPVYKCRTSRAGRAKPAEDHALKELEDIVRGGASIHLPHTQEYVEWVNEKHGRDVLRKLHDGHFAVQDCLDLHGVVLEEAEKAVHNFLMTAIRQGFRCVKIIHGRGLSSPRGPVLKKAVIQWLLSRYRKYLVGFVTARQCDGGLGALYILFR